MVVVSCDAATNSCVMVNPHLHGPSMMNTVYHTNCVLENLIDGHDQMSFYSWPTAAFETARYGGSGGAPLTVTRHERVTDAAVLREAASLVPELVGPKLNPVSMTNRTVAFEAWDVWRVEFGAALPAGVGRTALVQVDTISNAGTVIRNSLLTDTNCNLGRLKSSHAQTRYSRATPSAARPSQTSRSRGCRSSSRGRSSSPTSRCGTTPSRARGPRRSTAARTAAARRASTTRTTRRRARGRRRAARSAPTAFRATRRGRAPSRCSTTSS